MRAESARKGCKAQDCMREGDGTRPILDRPFKSVYVIIFIRVKDILVVCGATRECKWRVAI